MKKTIIATCIMSAFLATSSAFAQTSNRDRVQNDQYPNANPAARDTQSTREGTSGTPNTMGGTASTAPSGVRDPVQNSQYPNASPANRDAQSARDPHMGSATTRGGTASAPASGNRDMVQNSQSTYPNASPASRDAQTADRSGTSAGTAMKDSVITAKIKANMAKDRQVSAMNIKVDTDNAGKVHLSGTAKSQAEADRAVSIARATDGVNNVQSDIRVVR